jgi:hypothetical protein
VQVNKTGRIGIFSKKRRPTAAFGFCSFVPAFTRDRHAVFVGAADNRARRKPSSQYRFAIPGVSKRRFAGFR